MGERENIPQQVNGDCTIIVQPPPTPRKHPFEND